MTNLRERILRNDDDEGQKKNEAQAFLLGPFFPDDQSPTEGDETVAETSRSRLVSPLLQGV